MAVSRVGEVFTFQVLFIDGSGTPIAVNSPTIEVFRFDNTGCKVTLQTVTPLNPVALETGRYTYAFTIPTGLEAGTTLYGCMRGIDPVSLDNQLVEQEVDLELAQVGGLFASFVGPS